MRLALFVFLCTLTILLLLATAHIIVFPFVGFELLVEPLLRIKLSFKVAFTAYPYLILYLFSMACLFMASPKNCGALAEVALVILGALSFASDNILSLLLISMMVIWIGSYALVQKNEGGINFVRIYMATIVGLAIAGLAMVSYESFITYGHINLSNELYLKLVLKSNTTYQQLFWIIPTIYFIAQINIAPISWLLRPMVDEFNSRQLAIYQIVSFSFLYNWLDHYIFSLQNEGIALINMGVLWALAAILAYQLLVILSSIRLRELLYSYVGYLMVLFFMIALLHHQNNSRIAIWGYACVVLSTSIIGIIVNMLDQYFSSNSLATIVHSAKYSKNFMRFILLLFMILMAIPGSINFVFIYSSIAEAFAKDIVFGSTILSLWVGMVGVIIMKMSYVIIHTSSHADPVAISKRWYLKTGIISMVIFFCGLIPSIF